MGHGHINARAKDLQRIRELFAQRFRCNFCALRPDIVLNMTQQLKVRTLQQLRAGSRQLVLVLLQPIFRRIFHEPGVVLHCELVPYPLGGTGVKPWARVIADRVKAQAELLVRSPIHNALFVQNLKYACAGLINKIEHVLVVWKWNELPQYTLAFVFLLLEFEHEFVKLLLQRLVGVVDAKLLECVDLECLEAEDVEDADGRATGGDDVNGLLRTGCGLAAPPGPGTPRRQRGSGSSSRSGGDAGVDLLRNKIEGRSVDTLDQRLIRLLGLSDVQSLVDHVPPCKDHL
mmetsp:Transcript_10299/g.25211  ORF Transcript_10299/g.25211 Transcript_10299/m.25211 type:complete len:288 (-) Transcript_10299:871-1734(-)